MRHFPITKGIVFQHRVGAVQAVDRVNFEAATGRDSWHRRRVRLQQVHGGQAGDGAGQADVGQVLFEGQDIASLKGRALRAARRNIRSCWDPYTSLDRMTVGDIIGEPFEIHPDAAPRATASRR